MTDNSTPQPADLVQRAKDKLAELMAELDHGLRDAAVKSIRLEQARSGNGSSSQDVYRTATDFRNAEAHVKSIVSGVVEAHKALINRLAERGGESDEVR